MFDLLFLEVNASYSHSMLSYGMLRAYTEKLAPEWHWHKIEFTVKNADATFFEAELLRIKPSVICATVYLFNREAVLELMKIARVTLPQARLVLGGPEFLGDNQQFLSRYPEIDAVLRGDESGFYHYLQNNEVMDGCFEGELDELPSPHQLGYVSPEKPFWQIETSRGCPGHCTFCTSSLSHKVKFHSIDRVRADLQALRGHGFRNIRVLDRTFNLGQARAIELLRLFREEFSEMSFHLEIEPAGLTPLLFEELAKAPVDKLHIEAGVQSLNLEVLQACRRSGEPENILNSLRGLLGCENFELHIDLIAGLPKQSLASLIDDVKSLLALYPHEIQLEKLKILPGTPLIDDNPDIEFNPEPPYEVISTPNMSRDDMRTAKTLSQLLDGFSNARQLHSAFAFAVKDDTQFLGKLLDYLLQHDELFEYGKPALDVRFEIMAKLLEADSPAQQVLYFAGLVAGIYKAEGRGRLFPHSIPADTKTIWSKANAGIPQRFFEIEFNGNVGECWANPRDVEWQLGCNIYYFKLYYGPHPSEILVKKPVRNS